MDPLPTIPTPFSARVREWRVRVLPPMVFLVVMGGCILVWRQGLQLSGLPAIAEGVRSTVASSQAGTVLRLNVRPYQMVQQGEPLLVVMPSDPNVHMDMLRNQLQLAQLRLQPTVVERNALDFERMRHELLRTKSELAVARVNLQRGENAVRYNEPLFKDGIVSEDAFDLVLKTRDAYQAEVNEKLRNVSEIEQRMGQLSVFGDPVIAITNNPVTATIANLEKVQANVGTNWGPITLTAPISGMVSFVARQEGEHALEGEPLIVINDLWSERIVGYLRQPYPIEPRIGMEVVVNTREHKRRSFSGRIAQLGAQMETITNTLAYVRQGSLVDVGLPVVVNIPKTFKIRPGEVVDVLIKSASVPTELEPGPALSVNRQTHGRM